MSQREEYEEQRARAQAMRDDIERDYLDLFTSEIGQRVLAHMKAGAYIDKPMGDIVSAPGMDPRLILAARAGVHDYVVEIMARIERARRGRTEQHARAATILSRTD